MPLESYLEKLRAKPEHAKQRFAFWTALGITAAIFMLWLASFTSIGVSAEKTVTAAVNKAGTPAQSLIAGVGGFFVDIKDMVFGPSVVKFNSVEVSPGK